MNVLALGLRRLKPTAAAFLGSRRHPELSVGPPEVRASVTPALGPVTVGEIFGLVVPCAASMSSTTGRRAQWIDR